MLRKFFAALTAAVIMLNMTACKKEKPEPETASKEHIFREEKIELGEEMSRIKNVLYNDGKIYIIWENFQNEGDTTKTYKWKAETMVRVMNLDGETERDVVIGLQEGVSSSYRSRTVMLSCADSGGGFVTIDMEYPNVSYYLVRYSETGEKLSETSLENLMNELELDYIDAADMLSMEDGTYLLLLEKKIVVIDGNGSLLGEIKDSPLPENTLIRSLAKTADGRIFTAFDSYVMQDDGYAANVNTLVEIDFRNRKFGEKYSVASSNFINGTDKYDLLIVRESGLAGYDIETGETETIIDWLKSGYDTSVMNEKMLNVLPDGRILCVTYDYTYTGGGYNYSRDDMVLSLLTEIPPEELPDKKVVKLYALSIDLDVRRRILEFNRNSLEYQVELTSFADYEDGTDKMNIAMISGNIPDIILLGTNYECAAPVESYVSKGLFANVYDFIDKDPEMKRSDFLENIFKAYEVDGKLYEIVPTFGIVTLVGKTSVVGEAPGWTMEEFMDFVDAHPDCKAFGELTTKDSALKLFIRNCYENYVDMKTGKCSFDSGEFIGTLEFCNRFPDEVPENAYMAANFLSDYIASLRSGERVFDVKEVFNCINILDFEKGYFDGEVTFKGFPAKSGSGSAVKASNSFAITAKAANPEGAWQFARYFLTEEYQDMFASNRIYSLPIRVSSLEKQAEACKELHYLIDGNGKKVYFNNEFYTGRGTIGMGVTTDEDNEKIVNFIKSVDSVYHDDRFITMIVTEEAGAYFAGQKSAEESARIIQDRVQNYINENR